jgi:hypothetical protein
MDDGTKLKPWGAPPIKGLFAIAFESQLGKPAVKFEVSDIDALNVSAIPNSDQVYNLVYRDQVLATFIPHIDAFKVTYEMVGAVDANKVRGFLVIETSVGKLTQKTTIPPGTDVNTIDQQLERQAFEKVEGHYMFTVLQTDPAAIKTLIDLSGRWASGGVPGPVIAATFTVLTIDMSAYSRPTARGSIVDDSTVTVTFPDDATYTGKLQLPNVKWSNGSVWTKL